MKEWTLIVGLIAFFFFGMLAIGFSSDWSIRNHEPITIFINKHALGATARFD